MARISRGRTRVKLRLLGRCGGGDCWEIALSSDYLMKQGFPHFRVLLTFSSALTNISAKY